MGDCSRIEIRSEAEPVIVPPIRASRFSTEKKCEHHAFRQDLDQFAQHVQLSGLFLVNNPQRGDLICEGADLPLKLFDLSGLSLHLVKLGSQIGEESALPDCTVHQIGESKYYDERHKSKRHRQTWVTTRGCQLFGQQVDIERDWDETIERKPHSRTK